MDDQRACRRPALGFVNLGDRLGIESIGAEPVYRLCRKRHEFAGAAKALEQKIARYRPRWLAFLGKAAWAEISKDRNVEWGAQARRFGGARVWVLPNPSGLNRNFNLAALVESYQALRKALAVS